MTGRIGFGGLPVTPPRRVRCEADDWSFDPRYTQGRCPICGWAPDGAPNAPLWLGLVNRLDWDMIGLWALLDLFVILGLIVVRGAGLLPGR